MLPFGSGDNVRLTTNGEQPATETETKISDEFDSLKANFFRLSREPVAGAIVFNRSTSTAVVRYVERATGHIYEVSLPTGDSLTLSEKVRVTNNTLPKIYEAYFRPDGKAVLLRFLKEDSDMVENLSLALTPPQATSTLYAVSSTFLRGKIDAVAVGPDNTLFYTLRDNSSVVASAFNGTGVRTLFSAAFNNWRLAVTGNTLVAYTKASADTPGYAYAVNPANGTLTKILGPLNGLVALPNALGNRVLYSYVENGRTKLSVKNITNNTSFEISPATLAEKCLWSIKKTSILFCGAPTDDPASGEPDNWYKGRTHFSDRLWLFDTDTNIAEVLIEPKLILGIDIDATDLKIAPAENYLIFTNRNDLSLWAFRLE